MYSLLLYYSYSLLFSIKALCKNRAQNKKDLPEVIRLTY